VGKVVPASPSASGNQGSKEGQIEQSDGQSIYQDEGTLELYPSEAGGNVRVPSSMPSAGFPPTVSRPGRLPTPTDSLFEPASEVGSSTTITQSVNHSIVSHIPAVVDTTTLGVRIHDSKGDKPSPGLFGKERLTEKGFSNSVINRLKLSHATSTQKEYKYMWTLFVVWTTKLKPTSRNPTTPSIPLLAYFK
jgi:hypothetical protein